jgi:hypothetical protein
MSLNDTTTTLNAGNGGDVMDESLVTQTDGTEAKRPRVVVGSDDGGLQTLEQQNNRFQAAVMDPRAQELLGQLLIEARATNSLLRMILSQMGGNVTLEEILG